MVARTHGFQGSRCLYGMCPGWEPTQPIQTTCLADLAHTIDQIVEYESGNELVYCDFALFANLLSFFQDVC